jgi:hypothetical protein
MHQRAAATEGSRATWNGELRWRLAPISIHIADPLLKDHGRRNT